MVGDVRLSNPTSKIKKLLKELPKNLILPGYVSGDIIKGAYGRADVFSFHHVKKQKELLF